ncbi:MAG: alpha/beta hydrolase [Stackebrandtia sp.]
MPEAELVSLCTADGIRLDAVHYPGGHELAIVLAHGFSGSWRGPRTRRIARAFGAFGGVIGFDFRGHGHSSGVSTVGDLEVFDVAAAVDLARQRGYRRVAVVGFSMGGSVAVRHAALHRGVDTVVSISGPAHWYYRGTTSMRMLHRAVETSSGRTVSRFLLGTRISSGGWEPVPLTPEAVAHRIAPTPLLVVHGDADRFFPLRHAHALAAAATDPKELWIESGMGHAESGTTPRLVARVGDWLSNSTRPIGVRPGA